LPADAGRDLRGDECRGAQHLATQPRALPLRLRQAIDREVDQYCDQGEPGTEPFRGQTQYRSERSPGDENGHRAGIEVEPAEAAEAERQAKARRCESTGQPDPTCRQAAAEHLRAQGDEAHRS